MEDWEVVRRDELFDKVWTTLSEIAVYAAPGSITPKTFARVAVDVVLHELRVAGAITPAYEQTQATGGHRPRKEES